MINQTIFFLAPAGASSFFYVLLGQTKMDAKLPNNTYYLPTVPAKSCLFYPPDTSCPDTGRMVGDYINSPFLPEQNEAYSLNSGWPVAESWLLDQLKQKGPHWRFVSMIRDGRNQVESLRSKETKIGMPWSNERFRQTCLGWQHSARNALDCVAAMPDRYKIMRFEDFTAAPLETIKEVFDFVGLELDPEPVQQTLDLLEKRNWTPNTNCSNLDVNNRWTSWSAQDLETFRSIGEQEIIELGYRETSDD